MILKTKLRKSIINFFGWKTNQKLIVIESDDWGSIRIKDPVVIQKMASVGVPVEESHFTRFDGLERTEDLENLFEVLAKVKDSNGNHACVTPLTLTSNPDFDAIRSNGLKHYKYESIETTYKRYDERRLLNIWRGQGIANNLFYPQFHGREHLSPIRWMNAIRQEGSPARWAFEYDSILGVKSERIHQSQNYMAAFEAVDSSEQKSVDDACLLGLKEFERIFGFKSLSAIPSQSIISDGSKKALFNGGVRYLQCGQHFLPNASSLRKINYFWGHQDAFGMRYWRRNVNFEPYKSMESDHVNKALSEISLAFRFNKPAVLSTHRINFTSRITTSVRDESLRQLEKLLNRIILKWPDVEFMNSEQLGAVISDSLDK